MGWFIRKIRGGIRCLRENGPGYTARLLVKKTVKKTNINIKDLDIYKIYSTFRTKVLTGYSVYSKFVCKYGDGAVLILSSPSYGDVYIFGRMFHAYTEREHGNMKPVYAGCGKPAEKEAKIFNIEYIETYSLNEFLCLYSLRLFDQVPVLHLDGMHHHMYYYHIGILSYLEGIHQSNCLEFIGAYLNVDVSKDLTSPQFKTNADFIEKEIEAGRLIPGDTVLLVPYARGMKIPSGFWEKLSGRLLSKGKRVYTNSSGKNEPVIRGTTAVCVPFDEAVPFAETAGAVTGLRCGLLDIVSEAKCTKISICPKNLRRRSDLYPLYKFFALEDMYGKEDQFDLIYTADSSDSLISDIMGLLDSKDRIR